LVKGTIRVRSSERRGHCRKPGGNGDGRLPKKSIEKDRTRQGGEVTEALPGKESPLRHTTVGGSGEGRSHYPWGGGAPS